MGEFESVKMLKQNLFNSLGDKDKVYKELMNKWFKMKSTRRELEIEIQKFLTNEQFYWHNQLLIQILNKCLCITAVSNETKPAWNRCSSYIKSKFEPIDPIFYEVTERQAVSAEIPPFISQDRILPNSSSMSVRATYIAWEHGLDGVSQAVAELISSATHHFLRNILVAIIRKRKGCCFKSNGFVHALGRPSLNPWLRNVSKREHFEFHALNLDANLKEILTPQLRRTRSELDHGELYFLASSDAPDTALAPISISDLLQTLKLHPSLVASNFTKSVNIEKMYARNSYLCND